MKETDPMDITPGSMVSVTVKRSVVSEKAAKTLSRLFAKDAANKPLRRKRKKLLADGLDERRRGGRLWEVRPKAPRLIQPKTGDACKILATTDVIGDLKSVARYVDVK
ncbi:MAG: hypothetical protein DCC66_07580 [Planctomycetota bacterium]|nr:MAG: hypothetical protein DCC66_07580 [Planctomycetota bacterium]